MTHFDTKEKYQKIQKDIEFYTNQNYIFLFEGLYYGDGNLRYKTLDERIFCIYDRFKNISNSRRFSNKLKFQNQTFEYLDFGEGNTIQRFKDNKYILADMSFQEHAEKSIAIIVKHKIIYWLLFANYKNIKKLFKMLPDFMKCFLMELIDTILFIITYKMVLYERNDILIKHIKEQEGNMYIHYGAAHWKDLCKKLIKLGWELKD